MKKNFGIALIMFSMIFAHSCKDKDELDGAKLAEEEKLIEVYVSENSGYEHAGSGVYVKTISEALPNEKKLVKYNSANVYYTGKVMAKQTNDGTTKLVMGSQFDKGTISVVVDQSGVIKGWHIALKQMKKAGIYDVIIPSKEGYRDKGSSSGSIEPYQTLYFRMEISGV